jgi:ABC-type transporter Mla subunit MlaD
MRRALAIAGLLLAVGLVIAWPATGDDGGDYLVRGYFDNGSFLVPGEEVRVAGATVGVIEDVDVSQDDELVSLEDGGVREPGKAVIVMRIDDDGFKDFREDASCLIRPQSLIGERFVDCKPTQPRAPGSEAPPELEEIEDGEPGEGQRFLPLENNGKSVDLDLINNIQRAPYRDRFRLIFNELGAALAARGDDLAAIVDRANPALRETNQVVNILAQQNRQLASLASNGDAVLEPLARERTSITGFFRNAGVSGQAAAERSDDIEEGLAKFPRTLREVRLTMANLKKFADEGTPLSEDIAAAGPDFSKATQKLGPFANATVPALQTLGDAGEAAGPKLVASDSVIVDLRDQLNNTKPAAENLASFLDTFARTNGFQYLMDFIYYSSSSINGFDPFGHLLRASLQITPCLDYAPAPFPGCEVFFSGVAPAAAAQKAQLAKMVRAARAREGNRSAIAPSDSKPVLPDLSPGDSPLAPPSPGEQPVNPVSPEPPPPTPDSQSGQDPDQQLTPEERAQARRYMKGQQLTMRQARMLLRFLMGGTA